jgi:phytol kinase
MTSRDWLSVGGVMLALLAGLPLLRTVVARCGGSAEVSRKSVHVLMGTICVAFPWIFESPLPVWILAALATMPLAAVRLIPSLRSGLGSALHGISRPSYGEVLFAPAVAVVFHYSGGDPFLHGIPIGILTIADAASALGGTRWGKRRYGCGGGFKSVEGSLIFLVTAFLCGFLPLWLGGRTEMSHAFWIALTLSTLAMMSEGISDRGFDNLVIPVFSVFVLERLLDMDNGALSGRFAVLAALLALVMTGSRWSTLNGGALLGSAFLGYGCVVLAGWHFALPPSAVFVCHVVITRKHQLTTSFDHRLDAVLSHAIACLPWVLSTGLDWISYETGLAGISFAMMAQLAVLDAATRDSTHRKPLLMKSVSKGLLVAGIPGLIWLVPRWEHFVIPLMVSLVLTFAVVAAIAKLPLSWRSNATGLWILRGLMSLIVSLPALSFRP